jgi:hypothetical protein
MGEMNQNISFTHSLEFLKKIYYWIMQENMYTKIDKNEAKRLYFNNPLVLLL